MLLNIMLGETPALRIHSGSVLCESTTRAALEPERHWNQSETLETPEGSVWFML